MVAKFRIAMILTPNLSGLVGDTSSAGRLRDPGWIGCVASAGWVRTMAPRGFAFDMVFSSIIFIFYFLPAFFLLYWALPFRNTVILLASLLFYAWSEPGNLAVLLPFIVFNWFFGIAIAGSANTARRVLFVAGVAVDMAFMLYFKYLGFLVQQVNATLGWLHAAPLPDTHVALPLGISFFVFQGISYLTDVHRGDVKVQRNLVTFAAYKSMFPQLIAGPIVRYSQVARKFAQRRVTLFRLHTGGAMFIIGLAQKTLIANVVAQPANDLFSLPHEQLSLTAAWFGVTCYTLQIYFDFAGYSNMAIGMGHMMGFTFPTNFNLPYASRSVTEFWRRWHMTLSAWFRDYVYIPLGGNRRGRLRTYANLVTVFLLCGFWHGANWTFAAWGLWHGLFLAIERMGLSTLLARRPAALQHVYTMIAVMGGWVLFRADTIGGAGGFIAAMVGAGHGTEVSLPIEQFATPSVLTAILIGCLCAVTPRPAPRALTRKLQPYVGGSRLVAGFAVDLVLSAALLVLLVLSLATLAAGSFNPFIYFRF